MKRIRNLVEIAYRKDPRIAMFKEQEKLKKENQRNERRKALEEKKAEDERKKLVIFGLSLMLSKWYYLCKE